MTDYPLGSGLQGAVLEGQKKWGPSYDAYKLALERTKKARFFLRPASHMVPYSIAPATQPTCDFNIRKSAAAEGRAARRARSTTS